MNQPPAPSEYAPFYQKYVDLVPAGQNPLAQLRAQPAALKTLLAPLTDQQYQFRYAPGKWSISEALVHMMDTERIFSYRALRIGRGDTTPLVGFDQDRYVPESGADARAVASIWAEYAAVRAATLCLFESFGPATYLKQGVASGGPISVRALVWIIVGHEAHHMALFRERYLAGLGR